MLRTWVVIAESARARILAIDSMVGPLQDIESMTDTSARAQVSDLTSDRPGRSFDSVGRARHAMETEVEPKHQQAVAFAKEISERLERGGRKGAYEAIILVSPPAFLGILRRSLGKNAKSRVTKEISKNLVQKTNEQIREYLF